MANAYRGLTLRFAADGTKVLSELRAMKRAASDTASELKTIKQALKIDPSNLDAAKRHTQLLGQQAGIAQAEFRKMREQLRDLGTHYVESAGMDMRTLANQTKSAASQASIANERYNTFDQRLEEVHRSLSKLWRDNKELMNFDKDPFRNWSSMHIKEIREALEAMANAGVISRTRLEELTTTIKGMKAAQQAALGELNKYKDIAAFQSWENQAIKAKATVRASIRSMVADAKKFQATKFDGPISEASTKVEKLEAEAKTLKHALKLDPTSFKTLAMHAEALEHKVEAVKQQNKLLNDEIKLLERNPAVKELAADWKKLEQESRRVNQELDKASAHYATISGKLNRVTEEEVKYAGELAQAREVLGENSDRVKTLVAQWERAKTKVEEYTAKEREAAAALSGVEARAQNVANAERVRANNAQVAAGVSLINSETKAQKKANKVRAISNSTLLSLGMSMYSTVYPAMMMFGHYAVSSAEEVDSAYRNMRKTVNGTEQEFEALKRAAIDYGNAHYTSADTILEIEALGGQLGLGVDKLEAFSKAVSNIEIATDLDAETAALQMGQLFGIMPDLNDQYDKFADALVRLGNNAPAMESSIMNITKRIGPMSSLMQMSTADTLAWSTALAATGQGPEAAGTALAKTMAQIEAAVGGGTQGLQEAMEELGETLTDEEIAEAAGKLQDFANVAGMTAEQFADTWQNKPTEAMKAFIEGLRRIDQEGGSVDVTLQNLKITGVRQKQALEGLTQTYDQLNEYLGMSNAAFDGQAYGLDQAGDAAREASNKSQGFSGQLQIMSNNVQSLGASMAESLSPLLATGIELIQALSSSFQNLSPQMQRVTTITISGLAALGPGLTMLASFRTGLDGLRKAHEKNASASTKFLSVQSTLGTTMPGLVQAYGKNAAKLEDYSVAQKKAAKRGIEMSAAHRSAAASARLQNAAIGGLTKGINVMKGAVKTCAVMLAVDLAAQAIGFAVEKISDMQKNAQQASEHIENMEKATTGLSKALATLESNAEAISVTPARKWAEDYTEQLEDLIKKQADMGDSFLESNKTTSVNVNLLERHAETIKRLAGNCTEGSSEMAELSVAVEEYNRIAGTNYSIIDETTGAIDASTEALNLNTEAWVNNAKKQAASNQVTKIEEQKLETEKTYNDLIEKRHSLLGQVDYYRNMGRDPNDIHLTNGNSIIEELKIVNKQTRDTMSLMDSLNTDEDNLLKKMAEYTKEERQAALEADKLAENIKKVLSNSSALEGRNIDVMAEQMHELGVSASDLSRLSDEAMTILADNSNLTGREIIAAFRAAGEQVDNNLYVALLGCKDAVIDFAQEMPKASAAIAGTGTNFQGFIGNIVEAGHSIEELSGITDQQLAEVVTSFDGNIDTTLAKVQEFRDANKEAMDAIIAEYDGIDESFGQWCDKFNVHGEEGMRKLAEGISNGSIDPETASQEAVDAMILNLEGGEWYQAAEDIGRNLSEGLKNGIEGTADLAPEAAGQMADGVIKRAREVLGVQSPSVVFEEIGVHLMEGMRDGIENGASEATDMARDKGEEIAEAFRDAIKRVDVSSAGRTLVNSMLSGMGDAYNLAYSRGALAGQGFYDGLNSKKNLVSSLASTIAAGVSSAMARAGGEGSPWRTTAERGKYAALGLAKGLQDNMKFPARAAGMVTKETLNSISESVNRARNVQLPEIELLATPTYSQRQLDQLASLQRPATQDNSSHLQIGDIVLSGGDAESFERDFIALMERYGMLARM